jgi:hypothetical protein
MKKMKLAENVTKYQCGKTRPSPPAVSGHFDHVEVQTREAARPGE